MLKNQSAIRNKISLVFAPWTKILKAGVIIYNAAIMGKNQKEVKVAVNKEIVLYKSDDGFCKYLNPK